MQTLFVIGNGFDINLGMKTRYFDFFKFYKGVESDSELVNKLKNEISTDIENWADLELAFGQYTARLNNLEEFEEVYEDLSDNLKDYLESVENGFNYENLDLKKVPEYLCHPEKFLLPKNKNEVSKWKSEWTNHSWSINVISLNYTCSLEKLLGDKQIGTQIGTHHNSAPIKFGQIEHIHGYLNKRMILGVNDVSQIANVSFQEDEDIINAIVKDDCNKAYRHTLEEKCKKWISSSQLICLFGSSIGETDKLWWELIGEKLKSNSKLIIFDVSEVLRIKPNCCVYAKIVVNLKRKKSTFFTPLNCALKALILALKDS
ncbi:AbiH family protein, partial [Formosa sp. PL04]|uniref:AbiH family protein n=1 Tax=Formosa sp. PL04 TaxID=3081755 RepID=UPI002980E665